MTYAAVNYLLWLLKESVEERRQAREAETAKASYQKRNTRTRNSPVKKQQTHRLKGFHGYVSLFLFRFS